MVSFSSYHWLPWTSLLLLIDGIFHTFSSQRTFERYAPDYLIAKALFGNNTKGLSTGLHRFIGIFLILSSVYALTQILQRHSPNIDKSNPFLYFYAKVITPFTLTIISTGIFLFFCNK